MSLIQAFDTGDLPKQHHPEPIPQDVEEFWGRVRSPVIDDVLSCISFGEYTAETLYELLRSSRDAQSLESRTPEFQDFFIKGLKEKLFRKDRSFSDRSFDHDGKIFIVTARDNKASMEKWTKLGRSSSGLLTMAESLCAGFQYQSYTMHVLAAASVEMHILRSRVKELEAKSAAA